MLWQKFFKWEQRKGNRDGAQKKPITAASQVAIEALVVAVGNVRKLN